MAVGIKRLCGVALPATTLTAIYTATQEVALSTVVVCNRGTTATTFRLAHAPGGAADSLGDYFAYDAPIAPKQMVPFTIGICLAATDVLRAYAGNANLTVIAWGEEGAAGGAGTFLDLVDTPDSYTGQAGKVVRVNAGATATEFGPVLGTMAQQDANAVAITGGAISIGGHTPTGVLDVQGSVVASDIANRHFGVRVWPVAPAGSGGVIGVRIETGTGSAVGTAYFRGMTVENPPATSADVMGVQSNVSAGTSRYNLHVPGTAPNYFAGQVGIGGLPAYPLDVTGQARVTQDVLASRLFLGETVSTDRRVGLWYNRAIEQGMAIRPSADTGGGFAILFVNAAGGGIGGITTTATATAYNTNSDVRLKHAVQALGNAVSTIQALKPVSFKWNADDSPGIGFLAHELMRVVPEAVTGEPDAVNDDGGVRPQGVDHSKLVPWLTAALQEAVAQVQDLVTRVTALEGASA